ncbi:MAG: hypothetical protein A2Z18_04090 [Armatimonadetes bacterium RBG_16_58_9]|nr:MAG: hypothetical protein A2Z18_04090 [Armatimonadetes bacterium RBG_16_58_9]
MKVVTADQMRALDRRATEQYGFPSLILMENAGRAVYEAAVDLLDGDVREKDVLVVAGQGNNGGDGFVAARHLHNAGASVTIAYYGDRDKAKGDALTNIEIAEKMGLDIRQSPLDAEFWAEWRNRADLLIDALLGTGIKAEVRKPYSDVIDLANDLAYCRDTPVLAVDVPSGIDADTGMLLGPAVSADTTVTFALPKIGLVTYPGAGCVGELIIGDIGIPQEALEDNDCKTCLLDSGLVILGITHPRQPDAHKGSFGHLAIVAGSVGMTGAATLAAEGALRVGTGLVTLAVPDSLNDIIEAKLTEAMTIPVPECAARAFGAMSLDAVCDIIDKRDAAVIGPGFGRHEDTIAFTLELIRRLKRPAIIDADALYAVSTDLSVLDRCKAPLVITPHPGEMATLLGTTVVDVQSNRLEVARTFAGDHKVTVVLKGAGTVVARPDGTAFINTSGTPAMASGGVGDVLSGMIGGLLAQGMAEESALAAVYLHGRAGELAAAELGERAVIASDVAARIGDAVWEVDSEA